MISHFFINRPVFACVLSLLILFIGVVSLKKLPIEQYPNITPPQVQISVTYPGASAQILADSVASALEDQINGVEDMIYMYSQSAASGNLVLSVFFELGTDIDTALSNVQDRVDQALPQLPIEVQKEGVTVKKETPNILLIVAIQSADGRYSEVDTSNFATIHIADELLRLNGISDAKVINARDYSMRIWLRPDRMAQLGITTNDVVHSIQDQNDDYPIGQLGQQPNKGFVPLTLSMTSIGRLDTTEEYENIILRATPDGAAVRIKDIGRAELGAQDYTVNGELNGVPTTLIAIYQDYGANALDVAAEVKTTLKNLAKRFPMGITYSIPYDTTTFIKISINEVERTLYEAAILVALVVFIFLQSLRATLIPVIAMIVSIVGTFAGMELLGFSLNTLTLFGLVLSIGIVVDDAIVVVENVERNMRVKRLPPKDAAIQAMKEVSGPIFAIVFVLCAVFIPVGFIGGIAGELYKQFAITIAISVVVSGFVALTLSPVLAAFFFKREQKKTRLAESFNWWLARCTEAYVRGAAWLIDLKWVAAFGFFAILILILYFFKLVPGALVPQEDQGYIFTFASLPEGSSVELTERVTKKVEPIVFKNPAVENFVSMTGFSLLENLNRSNVGTYFVILKNWDKRKSDSLKAQGVINELFKPFSEIPDAQVIPVNPPAIQGLGTVGGFEFWIVDEGSGNARELEDVVQHYIQAANAKPELRGLRTSIQTECTQVYANVDRIKAKAYQVPIKDIYDALQSLLGSVYVNNFNKYSKIFKVMVQAEPEYRTSIEELGNIYVRSETNQMIPIKSLVNFYYSSGPNLISRFNGRLAAKINGGPGVGYSSGQAMAAMESVANEILTAGYTYAWSGAAYMEQSTGGASISVLLAALLLVFLILAALYERWLLPLAILLVVPFGILGALIAVWLRGLEDDVYFQIGLVTLIALAAKNAILIVEFAMQRKEEGLSIRESALEAGRQRFRAIMMTSLTFILGVLPLVISTGAGASSRHSVGTGVMGGMIAATFLGIFFIPFFYRMLEREKKKPPRDL